MLQTNTLIVGASISGLALSACLQKQNIPYLVIEKDANIAMPWRNHYERLHLHTNKRVSNLPYKKFEKKIQRYPSRQEVVNYLEDYKTAFNINPIFNTEANSIRRNDDHWLIETNKEAFKAHHLVLATGAFGKPKIADFPGMETFNGPIIHSSQYRSGKDFKGKKVLVVGFGNSACEIAIDLYEQGASPSMSVRSPVNIIPRDLAGIPILELSQFLSKLPPRLADTVNAPLIKLLVGDISKFGLTKKAYGPFEEIRKDMHIPVIDIGIVTHIRKGHVSIHKGIARIDGNTVIFSDGYRENFDAIIAAVGYENNCSEIVAVETDRFDDLKMPTYKQKYFGKDGLYFCGFWIAPTGQIREIAKDAKKIAKDIASKNHVN